jgi:hypothetical protein
VAIEVGTCRSGRTGSAPPPGLRSAASPVETLRRPTCSRHCSRRQTTMSRRIQTGSCERSLPEAGRAYLSATAAPSLIPGFSTAA